MKTAVAAPDHFLAQKVGVNFCHCSVLCARFCGARFCSARGFAARAVLWRARFCGARGFAARVVLRCMQFYGARGCAQPLPAIGNLLKIRILSTNKSKACFIN